MQFPQDFIDKNICGDVLKVMKSIPDKSIDLVVTSPLQSEKLYWQRHEGRTRRQVGKRGTTKRLLTS